MVKTPMRKNVENTTQILERLDRVIETVKGYRSNLHPEPYREMMEDLSIIRENIVGCKTHIDDSVMHRTYTIAEIFGFINEMNS